MFAVFFSLSLSQNNILREIYVNIILFSSLSWNFVRRTRSLFLKKISKHEITNLRLTSVGISQHRAYCKLPTVKSLHKLHSEESQNVAKFVYLRMASFYCLRIALLFQLGSLKVNLADDTLDLEHGLPKKKKNPNVLFAYQ